MPHATIVIPPNPARISAELLTRYATRGPRYTSYPTAPHFRDDLSPEKILGRWAAGGAEGPDLSIYVHIPFCRRRCSYCGCFTNVAFDPARADPYLDELEAEFALFARYLDPSRPVRQLALGGGSPTFLTPDRFNRLMRSLRAVWTLAEDAEISVEIDPRTATDGHVEVMRAHGFNRFSLGVQDFDSHVLALINRRQSRSATRRLCEALRARGEHAINFDLIHGLPGQTEETLAATAREVVDLGPSRIALFSYAHVPWMRPHQRVLEKYHLPTPGEKLALFGAAWDVFVEGGYVPVGMDHFAAPEDELAQAQANRTLHRNFMGYTTRRGLDLIAFGASAISSVARSYAQNTKDLRAYGEAVRGGRPAFERGYFLSDDDAARRELILELFCNFELDGEAFGKAWGLNFEKTYAEEREALADMEADGLVEIDGPRLRVTPLGRAFIRNVCMTFDRYLESDPKERRYSQTV